MKVILTIKEKDLDSLLEYFLRLEIKKIKIKRKVKKQNVRRSASLNTYNEPDE